MYYLLSWVEYMSGYSTCSIEWLFTHSTQLNWMHQLYSTQLNWVERNAWVWVYSYIHYQTDRKQWMPFKNCMLRWMRAHISCTFACISCMHALSLMWSQRYRFSSFLGFHFDLFRFLKFSDFPIVQFSNIEIFKFWNFQILPLPDFKIFWC